MSRRQYAIHRWIGAIVGVQLFAWTLGGLMFALHDIDWVHGSAQQREAPELVDASRVRLSPGEALQRSGLDGKAEKIVLRPLLGAPVYQIEKDERVVLVDATTGAVRSPIDESSARAIALAEHAGEPAVIAVTRFEAEPPIEYREKPLPAWRVSLDDGEGTNVWIGASSGQVTAWRNDAWRRFDFFWMLHTMDYSGRDDFNHPLLLGFASAGLLSVLTGASLWALRVARRWRRRPGRRRDD